ncbi:MAG: electron transfer flavoprotein subunit beta/FixA family protein [Firmicutes bacterium]|nr:electron transfer flavoprotein subunit beta/FixA family protein [Bacillota bacterium]
MNLLVCIKQVPDTTEIRIDPETNTLIRTGVPSIVNPFDSYALETASRIKDEQGGRIFVITMGPPQAKEALIECLGVGADKAYLVSDRLFSGSDTLATSYILSAAIRALQAKEGAFDIIFCGKQAIDGDTAQVGPEIAEHLDLPQVTYAVEAKVVDNTVVVKRENDDGYAMIEMTMPCLVTVTKPAYELRLPTIKSKMAAKRAEIIILTSQDIEIDLQHCGLKGSPTKVKKTFTPQVKKGGLRINEADGAAAGYKLAQLLFEAKMI